MIQYVEAKGTHMQIGSIIGKTLKTEIRQQIINCNFYYEQQYQRTIQELHQFSSRFLPHAQKYFPQYVEELQGMAHGAGVSFDDLFVILAEEEVISCLEKKMPDKCTTLAAKSKNNYILAHNEDYMPIYGFYAIKAQPKDEPEFLSIAYLGTLSGSSVALNNYMVFSGNTINATKCKYGIPKNILLRAMCSKKTIDEIIELWKLPRAIGSNAMIVTKEKIFNIEATPEKIALFEEKELFYHTNHLLHDSLKCTPEKPTESSIARYKRLSKLLKGKKELNEIDIVKTLSDHEGKLPICRHSGVSQTLACSIIDFENKSLILYDGNTCNGKKWIYHL